MVSLAGGVLCTFVESTATHKVMNELARANAHLKALIEQAPVSMVVWEGPQHRCSLFNDHCKQLTSGRVRVGSTLLEMFPELEGHPLVARLRRVYDSGQGDDLPEEHIPLRTADGTLHDKWFSTSWRALRDVRGDVYAIVAVGVEVTEQVLARRVLEDAKRDAESTNRAKDDFLAMLEPVDSGQHRARSMLNHAASSSASLPEGSEVDHGPVAKAISAVVIPTV